MALINLPQVTVDGNLVTPQWDTTKSMPGQSKEAQAYVGDTITSIVAATNTQEECGNGSGVFRWTQKTHTDTANGLKVVAQRTYLNSAADSAAFAVQEHTFTVEAI